MTSTDHTFSTLTATSVRSIHLMANGSLADLGDVIHPFARNREAIDEPPATGTRSGRHPRQRTVATRPFERPAWEVHDTSAEGDLVVVHATMTGRQVGTFVAYGPDGAPTRHSLRRGSGSQSPRAIGSGSPTARSSSIGPTATTTAWRCNSAGSRPPRPTSSACGAPCAATTSPPTVNPAAIDSLNADDRHRRRAVGSPCSMRVAETGECPGVCVSGVI